MPQHVYAPRAALKSSGASLPVPMRQQMESLFAQSFSHVRIHTDAEASRAATALDAQAFTVGRDVAFAAGAFAPDTLSGRQLIAHELAHVVQQSQGGPERNAVSSPGDVTEREADHAAARVARGELAGPLHATGPHIQRACNKALGAATPDCTFSTAGTGGWPFLFKLACDELLPGEEANLSKIKPGARVQIHGFASIEGDPGFNLELSCHRANKIADLMRTKRPDCSISSTFKHGASPGSGPGLVPDPNPRSFWRMAMVQEEVVAPEPQAPSACGPDITDWLVDQIGKAKRNKKVADIKSKLDVASQLAPMVGNKPLLVASEVLEGAVATQVGKAWNAAGNPHATPDANQQLSNAQIGTLEFQTALSSAGALDTNAIALLTQLRDASLAWRDLVGTGRPFDFKDKKAGVLGKPVTSSCPDSGCENTVTLCPGSKGSNCFEKDLPGNLVFATIGRMVGFSELALQLGSQWAQLMKTSTWDPIEDTAMISWAYGLPPSITRATLCAAIQTIKAQFPTHACHDCTQQLYPTLVDP